jgi:hypothetical protein
MLVGSFKNQGKAAPGANDRWQTSLQQSTPGCVPALPTFGRERGISCGKIHINSKYIEKIENPIKMLYKFRNR